jgi:DNA-binding CsgD family transcriptional regulator
MVDGAQGFTRPRSQAEVIRPFVASDKLYELIETIYAAASSPNEWKVFLAKFIEAVSVTSVAIFVRSLSSDYGVQVIHHNFPSGALEELLKNHTETAPWISIVKQIDCGVAFSTEDHVPLASIMQTPFYEQFLKPFGIGGGFGVKLRDGSDRRALFMATCAHDRIAAMKPEVLALINGLAPHLQRALAIRWALRRERAKALEDGLVRQVNPVFILNDRRQVLFMNPPAWKALDERIVEVDKVDRAFRLISRNDNSALDRLIEAGRGLKGRSRGSTRHLMSFSIAGAPNPNVLELVMVPAASEGPDQDLFSDATKEPQMLAILRLRGRVQPPSVEDIRTVLALSPREADVALGLVNGLSPEEIAKELEVSVDTIRWHLKNIYQRVGCSSQAELVRMLLSLVGPAQVG